MYTENLSQELAVVGVIHSQSLTAGTYTIQGIDMSYFRRILFIVDMGVVTATGTLAFVAQGCSTSGGTYVTIDGTNAALATASTSNKILQLELRAEKVGNAAVAAGTSYRYVGCLLTTANAATLGCVIALGAVARNKPASLQDIAAVAQKVVF